MQTLLTDQFLLGSRKGERERGMPKGGKKEREGEERDRGTPMLPTKREERESQRTLLGRNPKSHTPTTSSFFF